MSDPWAPYDAPDGDRELTAREFIAGLILGLLIVVIIGAVLVRFAS